MDFNALDEFFDQLDDEQLRIAMQMPSVQKVMEATRCEDSHDLEHHWPFNIDRQEEREDCIFCGKTKRQVTAEITTALRKSSKRPRKTGARPGEPARPGKSKRVKIDDYF